MGKGSNKRFLSVLLCLLMVVGLVAPLSTKKAEAATSVTINKNSYESRSISYGQYTFNLTLKDAYTSLTVYKDSWFSYTKSGSTYVVTVAANTSTSQRKGSILFKETRNNVVSTWELRITQSGKPKPTNTPTPTPKLTANVTSLSFGSGAESKTVTITKGRTGTLSVSGISWITAKVSGSTVTLTASRNTGAYRSGTLTIKDGGSGQTVKISISQNAAPTPTPTKPPTPTPTKPPTPTPTKPPTPTPTPKMTVDTTSLTFGSGVETKSVRVTAGQRGTLRADRNSNAMWLTATVNGSSVTFTTTKNTGAARTGTVDITDTGSGQTVRITVNQGAAPTPTPTNTPTPTPKPTATPVPKLSASETSVVFPHKDGTISIQIVNQVGALRADRNTDSMWFTAVVNGSFITISVKENPSTSARVGHVDVTDTGTGQTVRISVQQKGSPETFQRLSVSPSSINVGANGGEIKLTVSGASGLVGVNIEPQNKGIDESRIKIEKDEVIFYVSPNLYLAPREWTITIRDPKTEQSVVIKLRQDGAKQSANTPTPTPTNTPTPKPPKLTNTPTPKPKPTNTPKPKPTNTPKPKPTNTPTPKPENTPAPTGGVNVPTPTARLSSTPDLTPVITGGLGLVTPTPGLVAKPGKVNFDSCPEENVIVSISRYTNIRDLIAKVDSDFDEWLHVTKISDEDNQFIIQADVNCELEPRSGQIEFVEKGTENSIVVPVYQRGYYVTVTFDANGGTWLGNIKMDYPIIDGVYTRLAEKPVAPEGKRFDGWYTFPVGGELVSEGDNVDPCITKLYAHYVSDKTVTVTFDLNGGEEQEGERYKSATVYVEEKYGDVLYVPTHSDSNLRFAYWKDENGNEITRETLVKLNKDHTLTAEWEEPTYYIVRFNGNGSLSGEMEEIRCDYGEEYVIPDVGFDDARGFDGWCTSPDGKGIIFSEGTFQFYDKKTRVFTLYALWYERGRLTYHDGFTGKPRSRSEQLKHIFMLKGQEEFSWLKHEGLVFLGWSTNPQDLIGGTPEYRISVRYTSDGSLDLYPVYRTQQPGARVLIYSDEGGVGGPGVIVYPADKNNLRVSKKVPTRSHYEFEGWQSMLFHIPGWNHINSPVGWEADDSLLGRVMATVEPGAEIDGDWFGDKNTLVFKAKWSFRKTLVKLVDPIDNSFVFFPVDSPEIELPVPKRNGYRFCGWCVDKGTDADVIYFADGQKCFIPEDITILYAKWEKATFSVEIYDPFSNRVLNTFSTTIDDKLPGEPITVAGMHFEGWTDEKIWDSNYETRAQATLRQIRMDPKCREGEYYSKFELTDVIRLYPCYSLEEEPDGGITIFYVVEKNTTAPPMGHFGRTGEISLSDVEPSRYYCTFKGWSRERTAIGTKGVEVYPKGAKIDSAVFGTDTVWFLFPVWESKVKIELDPQCPGEELKDVSNERLPGDYVAAKDLWDLEYEGHYLTGWRNADGSLVVSINDSFIIPNKDTVLYAEWEEEQYTIYYHDGFTLEIVNSQQVSGCEADLEYFAANVPGYIFTGWKTGNNGGLEAFNRTPDYTEQKNHIKFTDDVHLYSCYEKDKTTLSDKEHENDIAILYNPAGGEGGPGLDWVSPEYTYRIRSEEPSRKGFEFVGWSVSPYLNSPVDARYHRGEVCEELPINRVIDLYAVWRPDTTNDLKYDMQKRFGEKQLPDDVFEREGESDDWIKINDTCYIAYKTENYNDSDYRKSMHSKFLIMEYKNGEWNLEAHGIGQSLSEFIEFQLYTNLNDNFATICKGICALGKTAVCLAIPELGIIVGGFDVYDTFQKVVCATDAQSYTVYTGKAVAQYTKDVVGAYLSLHGVEAGKAADITGTMLDKVINIADLYDNPSLIDAFDFARNQVFYGLSKGDEYYLKKAEKKFEELSEKIETKVIAFLDAQPELNGIKDEIETLKGVGYAIDIAATMYDEILDLCKKEYSYGSYDPFGNRDYGIGKIQEMAIKGHFNDRVANSVPIIARKIYEAYTSIK